ncbi:unnamed protein product [Urochloa humidicola]
MEVTPSEVEAKNAAGKKVSPPAPLAWWIVSYSSSSDEDAAAAKKGKSSRWKKKLDAAAMEFTPESELDAPELDDAPESEKLDDAPESEELRAPDSLPLASETTVPDSLPPSAFLCPRCHHVHEDRESWNRAHSWLYPCARCGLIHLDYWLRSPLGRDEFGCAAALAVKREMEEEAKQPEWRNMNSK